LEDCEGIERQVRDRMVCGSFDFAIFCGDRFLKREPEDEVKTRADRLLQCMSPSVPHVHLIGNHDWVSKAMNWHTSESLAGLSSKLVVLASPQSVSYGIVGIHALPSGYVMDMSKYQINKQYLNVFIFHDMIQGCKLDDNGKVIAGTGMRLSDIDRPEFNLVFGGDIHIPQKLPFKHTQGGYVGAVLQRTRADADCERGWLEVTADQTSTGWHADIEFVPTRNFFTRLAFDVDDSTQFENLTVDSQKVEDLAVEIELRGTKVNVDRLAGDSRWNNYLEYHNARSISILRKYKSVQKEAVVDLSETSGVLEDLHAYIDSGFVDLGTVSKQNLFKILEEVK
jgi:DNA repair exonuclease SbcCD nuclease subunit